MRVSTAHRAEQKFDELVRVFERGLTGKVEFMGNLHQCFHKFPQEQEQTIGKLKQLQSHPRIDVRDVVTEILNWIAKWKARILDIDQNRRSSPLQPGRRIRLSGGYTSVYAKPPWLGGREYLMGTFIDFVERGPDKMPGAIVQLDDRLTLPQVSGQVVLLTLMHVSNCVDRETVTVFLTDTSLEDTTAFAAAPLRRCAAAPLRRCGKRKSSRKRRIKWNRFRNSVVLERRGPWPTRQLQ